MEGSAAYARSYLKADLRNTRTLLGLLEEDETAEVRAIDQPGEPGLFRQLAQLVHDVTVGLREAGTEVDVDALRRFVEVVATEVARERRIADDTMLQWARSFERVLPWWTTLPAEETLLAEERWPSFGEGAAVLELRVTADERFRVLRVVRTRDAVRACFEKYLSKHPAVEALHLVDGDGEPVATLVADDAGAHWV